MNTTNTERKVWRIEDAEYAQDAAMPERVIDAWVRLKRASSQDRQNAKAAFDHALTQALNDAGSKNQ